jgi:hypothetical protein
VGWLAVEELRAEVDAGRIDTVLLATVLLAIADLQGRLLGKHLAATHERRAGSFRGFREVSGAGRERLPVIGSTASALR